MSNSTAKAGPQDTVKTASAFTHAELCTMAARWLRLPHSKGGHGCQISFTEPRAGQSSGEIPDGIGFRISEWVGGSVMVECKTTRSDFLADARKPHRHGKGMGRWRYYLCPEGIIYPDELPPRWGLLVVTSRRKIRALAGAASELPFHSKASIWPDIGEVMTRYELDHDSYQESQLLASLLYRVGDAQAVNLRIREADGNVSRLVKKVEDLRNQLQRVREQRLMDRFEKNDRSATPRAVTDVDE